jgi:hypothetical protein
MHASLRHGLTHRCEDSPAANRYGDPDGVRLRADRLSPIVPGNGSHYPVAWRWRPWPWYGLAQRLLLVYTSSSYISPAGPSRNRVRITMEVALYIRWVQAEPVVRNQGESDHGKFEGASPAGVAGYAVGRRGTRSHDRWRASG